ncbi:MAG: 16S rRNA (uracil(1498)-N(3))-methyltransferase [Rhodoferax sp.]|nr:16S rRNA (uracil(1498)-N(3))-methyltransferase [Rhodoferax sp.]
MPRFFCPLPMEPGALLDLPANAARHVQVLRLQPRDTITLFDGGPDHGGRGGEFGASVEHMGRSDVRVRIGQHQALEREPVLCIQLVVGMPANERMDWLVEKAAELGVASIQPLMTERSVLRLSGERAQKKRAHWQSITVAACEQSGRNRVPLIHEVLGFDAWAKGLPATSEDRRMLLSLRVEAMPLREVCAPLETRRTITFLSGPEGGLSVAEEDRAMALGFLPASLGLSTLRAETAPLAALAAMLI